MRFNPIFRIEIGIGIEIQTWLQSGRVWGMEFIQKKGKVQNRIVRLRLWGSRGRGYRKQRKRGEVRNWNETKRLLVPNSLTVPCKEMTIRRQGKAEVKSMMRRRSGNKWVWSQGNTFKMARKLNEVNDENHKESKTSPTPTRSSTKPFFRRMCSDFQNVIGEIFFSFLFLFAGFGAKINFCPTEIFMRQK